MIQQIENKDNLLQHINSGDSAIKFTVGGTWPDGSVPFLETTITPQLNRTMFMQVYRKPTHTN